MKLVELHQELESEIAKLNFSFDNIDRGGCGFRLNAGLHIFFRNSCLHKSLIKCHSKNNDMADIKNAIKTMFRKVHKLYPSAQLKLF